MGDQDDGNEQVVPSGGRAAARPCCFLRPFRADGVLSIRPLRPSRSFGSTVLGKALGVIRSLCKHDGGMAENLAPSFCLTESGLKVWISRAFR